MAEKKKSDQIIHNSNTSQISIHNVNSKSTGSIEITSNSSVNLTTSSNQDVYSISIPSDFTSFTGSNYNLHSKSTKNIISKA